MRLKYYIPKEIDLNYVGEDEKLHFVHNPKDLEFRIVDKKTGELDWIFNIKQLKELANEYYFSSERKQFFEENSRIVAFHLDWQGQIRKNCFYGFEVKLTEVLKLDFQY